MEYRLGSAELFAALEAWNLFLARRVRLIACGGTAMTLLGVKASTRDIDFMVPDASEYRYLVGRLAELGYANVSGYGWQSQGEPFRFDLFSGNRIHTTELLESPLAQGNHLPLRNFSKIYLGVLNFYDLISSKLIRGTNVDFEDCAALLKARPEIDTARLGAHFEELASYDISHDRVRGNVRLLLERAR